MRFSTYLKYRFIKTIGSIYSKVFFINLWKLKIISRKLADTLYTLHFWKSLFITLCLLVERVVWENSKTQKSRKYSIIFLKVFWLIQNLVYSYRESPICVCFFSLSCIENSILYILLLSTFGKASCIRLWNSSRFDIKKDLLNIFGKSFLFSPKSLFCSSWCLWRYPKNSPET